MRLVLALALSAAFAGLGGAAVASRVPAGVGVGKPCPKAGVVAASADGTKLRCEVHAGVRRWARATGAAPTPTTGDTQPTRLAVTLHGTMTYTYHDQFSTHYPGGGSCTVAVIQDSRDTLTFSTESDAPILVTMANGKATGTAHVPYAFTVRPASQTYGAPTGVGPGGGACPAYDPPLVTGGCTVYHGSLPLEVSVAGREVTVSSPGSAFGGAMCSGGTPTKLYVTPATGTLPSDRGGSVAGRGHQEESANTGAAGDSTFQATFVPQ